MEIKVNGAELKKEEIDAYVKHIEDEFPDKEIETLSIDVDGEYVN